MNFKGIYACTIQRLGFFKGIVWHVWIHLDDLDWYHWDVRSHRSCHRTLAYEENKHMSNYSFQQKLPLNTNINMMLFGSITYSIQIIINIKTNAKSASHSFMPSSVSETLWFRKIGFDHSVNEHHHRTQNNYI